jgi:hypothetical protein
MVRDHNTDEATLLFVGAYLWYFIINSKLTFPLCYNFLNMGGLADGKAVSLSLLETLGTDYSASLVFIQYFGPAVNLTPLFGSGYNDWVPFSILFVCIIFLFNVHGKILGLFTKQKYFYDEIVDDTRDAEEGRVILENGIF